MRSLVAVVTALLTLDVIDGVSPATRLEPTPYGARSPAASMLAPTDAPGRDGNDAPLLPDAEALCAQSTISGAVTLPFDAAPRPLERVLPREPTRAGYLALPFRPPKPSR